MFVNKLTTYEYNKSEQFISNWIISESRWRWPTSINSQVWLLDFSVVCLGNCFSKLMPKAIYPGFIGYSRGSIIQQWMVHFYFFSIQYGDNFHRTRLAVILGYLIVLAFHTVVHNVIGGCVTRCKIYDVMQWFHVISPSLLNKFCSYQKNSKLLLEDVGWVVRFTPLWLLAK